MHPHHLHRKFKNFLILASFLITPLASGNTVINTYPGNGSSTTNRDIGQTFTVPTNGDNLLTTYQLSLGGAGAPKYQFLIYPYDPVTAHLIGTSLFSTGIRSATPGVETPVTFTPNLTLTPGGTYAAIIQQKGIPDTGDIQWRTNISVFPGFVNYPGGDQIFTDDSPPWTNTTWLTRTQLDDPNFQADMAFIATFTPTVPELPALG